MMTFLWILAPCRLIGRLFTYSALKIEAVCISETLASTDESTRRQKPRIKHQNCKLILVVIMRGNGLSAYTKALELEEDSCQCSRVRSSGGRYIVPSILGKYRY
jgi:hypothetical protein